MADYKTLVDIENLLKDHVPGKVVNQELEPLTQSGENYGSVILKADFTVENEEGHKKVHAVAKLIPKDQMSQKMFNTQTTFRSEILWYSNVVPQLQQFQREQNASHVADYFPNFYGGRISLNPNSDRVDEGGIILMENLKASGYSNEDRQQGFDLETTKLILNYVANLHSTSNALKLTNPDVFENIIRPCLTGWADPVFDDSFEAPEVVLQVVRENVKLLDYVGRVNKLHKSRKTKQSTTVRELWAGLVHNDLWVNNIMLKHENHNATKVKIVDFQCYDYGSFAKDLVFFIFSSVQTSVLKFHFDKLTKYYYDQYIANLRDLKVDTKEFTFKSFQEELLKEATQICHAIGMLFVVMAPKGGMGPPPEPPQEGEKPKFPPFKTPHFFKERIWTIVEIAAKKNWL